MRQPPAFFSLRHFQPVVDVSVRFNTLADLLSKHARPSLVLQKAPLKGKDRVYLLDETNGVSGVLYSVLALPSLTTSLPPSSSVDAAIAALRRVECEPHLKTVFVSLWSRYGASCGFVHAGGEWAAPLTSFAPSSSSTAASSTSVGTGVPITGEDHKVSSGVLEFFQECHESQLQNATRLIRIVLDREGQQLWHFTARLLRQKMEEGLPYVVNPLDARWIDLEPRQPLIDGTGNVDERAVLRLLVSGRLQLDEDFDRKS